MEKIRFKKLFPQYERYDYKHSVCIVLCFISATCTVQFFGVSVLRTLESVRDLFLSLGYYFCEMLQIPHGISPTVTQVPNLGNEYVSALPYSFAEFKNKLSNYGHLLIDTSNVRAYFGGLGGIVKGVAIFVVICAPVVICAVVGFKRALNRENNDYGYETLPLRMVKKVSTATYIPIKKALKNLIAFVRDNSFYIKIAVVVWLLNLNIITVFIEVLAYVFYLVASLDFIHIYTQVYKLFLDLSVPFSVIPLWLWIVGAIWLFCRFRKKIALARLRHFEMYDRGFINSLPIVSMVCGTMGKKKTTMLTDMVLSQEIMFRDKAFEKLLETDLKFPYFPWQNLENELKRAIEFHQVFNLATCRLWANKKALRWCRCIKQAKCFGYDFNRYGLTYNDNLKIVSIWETVETYAQLYFIYTIQSSLLVANYSVRTDSLLNDLGNFPLWNTDFFNRDSRLIDSFSRHAHILDYDMLRLGKRVLEDNPNANAFEFGVVVLTEGGKERGNALDTKEMKKNTDETNQKNDLFNAWLKMVRHSATVDNFPFVKVFMDEQRPMSMGADVRELCEIVHIRESGERRLALPFFFLESLIYDFARSHFDKFYINYRFNRADNSLILHIVKSVVGKLYGYFNRISNLFSFSVLSLQTESGLLDGNMDNHKYYLCEKKIYSKRFSTDCYSEYFAEKVLCSPVGLNDLTEYETERATFDELEKQNSYFINDLMRADWRKDKN